MRAALIVKQLDCETVALKLARHLRLERTLLRHGPKAEHVEILLFVLRAKLVPFLYGGHGAEKIRFQFVRLRAEVSLDHLISGRAAVRRGVRLSQRGFWKGNDQQPPPKRKPVEESI